DDNCDKISAEAFSIIQERSQLQKGDILFASISENGSAYIIEEDPQNWNINESVFTIRPNAQRIISKYFLCTITSVAAFLSFPKKFDISHT
ncbi:MAG: hypothetical protein J6Q27_04670, partial [Clostridia bacterium]|nr:hypothetical protein [Clostridia bacterium]